MARSGVDNQGKAGRCREVKKELINPFCINMYAQRIATATLPPMREGI